jgi:hypothetical protein
MDHVPVGAAEGCDLLILPKYFQLSAEVKPGAIRVVTETASHSHPLRFYTGHE